MTILGVDWGEKRIGVAIARTNLVEPLGVVGSPAELLELAKKEGVEKVILGLPEGKFEKRVKEFGKRIEEELRIPVVLRSEVLTSLQALEKSIEAGKSKKSRRELDSWAAALLLQEYLDEHPIA